jgi:uncharacterized protein YbaP (TraB family)
MHWEGGNVVQLTRREALFIMFAASVADASAASGPPLWVAARGRQKMFVFGQVSVKPDSSWFSPTIQQAFDSSTELWVENPEFSPDEIKAAMAKPPDGPTLKEAASAADLKRLHAVLERSGMAADAYDGVRLSGAYTAMARLAGHAAEAGVQPEATLKTRAKAAGKAIHTEWKSFAEIGRFQDDLPEDTRRRVQLELFQKELDEAADPQRAERVRRQWLAGNLDGLNAIDKNMQQRYPTIYQHVGADRNKAWASRLESSFASAQVPFVCVGALHVVGPKSIQAYLAQSGFAVRRA